MGVVYALSVRELACDDPAKGHDLRQRAVSGGALQGQREEPTTHGMLPRVVRTVSLVPGNMCSLKYCSVTPHTYNT